MLREWIVPTSSPPKWLAASRQSWPVQIPSQKQSASISALAILLATLQLRTHERDGSKGRERSSAHWRAGHASEPYYGQSPAGTPARARLWHTPPQSWRHSHKQ